MDNKPSAVRCSQYIKEEPLRAGILISIALAIGCAFMLTVSSWWSGHNPMKVAVYRVTIDEPEGYLIVDATYSRFPMGFMTGDFQFRMPMPADCKRPMP